MQKPPSLRNNNGSLQVRVRIDGKDAFINRLGRWSDPVAVAKAHAVTYPEGDAHRLHQALLLLKRSRCLNISAFCREAIAEKLERLEALK